MAKEQEIIKNYSIQEEHLMGEVQIADEVVAIIAGLAATHPPGSTFLFATGSASVWPPVPSPAHWCHLHASEGAPAHETSVGFPSALCTDIARA